MLIKLIIEGATKIDSTGEKGKNGVCQKCCSRQETMMYRAYMEKGAVYKLELCSACK